MADMKYIPLSNDIKTDNVRMIQRIRIRLNDYKFNVGDLLIDTEQGFESSHTNTRILPYANL